MEIQLPQKRMAVNPVQTQKRNVPLEQIIAVEGQNPLATAIDTSSSVLGQVLAKKAELKRQGEQLARQRQQVARLEQLSGQQPGSFEGLDPETAFSFAQNKIKQNADIQEEARKLAQNTTKIRALESQFGYKNGELGEEPSAALLKVQNDLINKRQETGAAAEARKLKEDMFKDTQVNKYSASLEKSGIPNAIAVGTRILSLLPERGNNVPGFGPVEKYVPNILVGDKGRAMRQAAAQLFNIELKTRSGTAVTDQELTRLKEEFGQGKMATEEALRTGVSQYLSRVKEIGKNIEAGYGPEIRSEYELRGGNNIGNSIDALLSNPSIKPLPTLKAPKPKFINTPEMEEAIKNGWVK